MGFIDEIKARAKACKKTIVLPETEDERTYKAAETVLKEGLADLVLVGSKEEIEKNKGTYDISGATIVDPATDARTEGYIAKELEDEYIVLPVGKRTEEVNEVISLSETAGFIYIHADQAEDIEELAQLVGNEYGIETSEVYEDVKNVVKTFREKGILL